MGSPTLNKHNIIPLKYYFVETKYPIQSHINNI